MFVAYVLMSNDRNWIWISFLCVCTREFYFIALNPLFKQEKRFEKSMKLCFCRELSAAAEGREDEREDYNR